MVDQVNEAGKVYNMKMNAKKTKTMVVSKSEEDTPIKIMVDEAEIEQVKNFIHLGHKITTDGRCEEEIRRRIGIEKTAFSKMHHVLVKTQISLPTRIPILHCYIWSTLLYGAETWTISKLMKDQLQAFEMWCYRRMLKISWTERVTNEAVLRRIKPKNNLYKTIQTKILKYFGHIIRRQNLQRTLLDGKIVARRCRRRPRLTWARNISQLTGLAYIEAVRRAHDRNDWRIMTSNPLIGDGT